MRNDFHKVICEEPRRKGKDLKYRSRRRVYKQLLRTSPEEQLEQESISKHYGYYRKNFGDHTKPLYRMLMSQVGKRWDDIYSELCRKFPKNKVVYIHVHRHVKGWVYTDVIEVDGELKILNRFSGLRSLEELRSRYTEYLYVDPRDGILKVLGKLKSEKRKTRKLEAVEFEGNYYGERDGIWYQLWFKTDFCFISIGRAYWDQTRTPKDKFLKITLTKGEAIRYYGEPKYVIRIQQINSRLKKRLLKYIETTQD